MVAILLKDRNISFPQLELSLPCHIFLDFVHGTDFLLVVKLVFNISFRSTFVIGYQLVTIRRQGVLIAVHRYDLGDRVIWL